MQPIYIPQLLTFPEKTYSVDFKEYLPGIDTLTPIQGILSVTHHGNYIEVSTATEAIVTLCCHRCLQQYNHRLSLQNSEMIWLDETANNPFTGPLEKETALEDLIETLAPNGYFQPGEWLYEQLCLALPQRQLCDRKCPGIKLQKPETSTEPVIDSRWASLAALQNGLNGESLPKSPNHKPSQGKHDKNK